MKTPQKLTNEQLLGLKQGEKVIEFIGGHFYPYKFEGIHSTGKYVMLSNGESVHTVYTNGVVYPHQNLYLASDCSDEFIGKMQIEALKRQIEFLKEQYGVKDEAPKTKDLITWLYIEHDTTTPRKILEDVVTEEDPAIFYMYHIYQNNCFESLVDALEKGETTEEKRKIFDEHIEKEFSITKHEIFKLENGKIVDYDFKEMDGNGMNALFEYVVNGF